MLVNSSMKIFLSILSALVILVALIYFGVIADYNITHPVWHSNATLYGGISGAVIAFLLFMIASKKPNLSGVIMSLVNIIFAISLAATLYYAHQFVNAADYNAFAAQMWHKSSYATIISFIPQVAHLMRRMVFSS